MMATCDTFKSGAIEQLRTHARRLQIPIFEKGYEKDPAVVAKSDVVLVDTSGHMQDNEPLMRALSKLINLKKPDLVLFVGEVLVGNDVVDQLNKFNQKLTDLSTVPTARLIDGILLTKFDTIDDKVGAALSMVSSYHRLCHALDLAEELAQDGDQRWVARHPAVHHPRLYPLLHARQLVSPSPPVHRRGGHLSSSLAFVRACYVCVHACCVECACWLLLDIGHCCMQVSRGLSKLMIIQL